MHMCTTVCTALRVTTTSFKYTCEVRERAGRGVSAITLQFTHTRDRPSAHGTPSFMHQTEKVLSSYFTTHTTRTGALGL
jgi:hypothetical protein